MKKKYTFIDDEWYPVPVLVEDGSIYDTDTYLTDEQKAFIDKAYADFGKARRMIHEGVEERDNT